MSPGHLCALEVADSQHDCASHDLLTVGHRQSGEESRLRSTEAARSEGGGEACLKTGKPCGVAGIPEKKKSTVFRIVLKEGQAQNDASVPAHECNHCRESRRPGPGFVM